VNISCNLGGHDESEPICVLESAVYKVSVGLSPDGSVSPTTMVKACLDTGGGYYLSRRDSLPPNTPIYPLVSVPRISAALGQNLSIIGACPLYLHFGEKHTSDTVEILEVEELVVPLLLGSTWIDCHVTSIEPRTRVVLIEVSKGTPLSIHLPTSAKSAVIRVATPRCLPDFSETPSGLFRNARGSSIEQNRVVGSPTSYPAGTLCPS
jgi:hypothetical protein